MDEETETQGDAAAIIEAVERLCTSEELDLITKPDGSPIMPRVVSLPSGVHLHSLKKYYDEFRERPERTTGTAKLETLPSFIDHVNRFKKPNTAVFATTAQLLAVYDYHDSTAPAFCGHRAGYHFPLSAEWKAWIAVNGVNLSQLQFAQFIEDHVMDITAPKEDDRTQHFGDLGFTLASPSKMLTISRGLLVRVESEAVSKPNLSTGEIEVVYKETHADSAGLPLQVPGGFMLLIAPFMDGALYRIPVRLRYRVTSGKVLWTVLMHRVEAVLRDAIKDACEEVIEKTSVPLFHGLPEA